MSIQFVNIGNNFRINYCIYLVPYCYFTIIYKKAMLREIVPFVEGWSWSKRYIAYRNRLKRFYNTNIFVIQLLLFPIQNLFTIKKVQMVQKYLKMRLLIYQMQSLIFLILRILILLKVLVMPMEVAFGNKENIYQMKMVMGSGMIQIKLLVSMLSIGMILEKMGQNKQKTQVNMTAFGTMEKVGMIAVQMGYAHMIKGIYNQIAMEQN